MAAATLAGLIPTFISVTGDGNGYYSGRLLWFGFLGVYGVVIYVVQMSWDSIDHDFWCQGNVTFLCQTECFEKHFNMAIVGLWYFFFFIFLAAFFLMEFFIVHIISGHIKMKVMESISEVEEGSMVGIQENNQSPKKNTQNIGQQKMLLGLYLFYFFLQLTFQTTFLCILIFRHLPLVNGDAIFCYTDTCPDPKICLVKGTVEKRMSIYTLITMSTMIIIFCIVFFIYSVYYYKQIVVMNSHSHRTWID
ncbi:uncharacterized protein LOC103097117 [Monodelphis domestica]|uniref:uncharacterized protein LOC103097117 n=1 Tax=Monodelphis domestica TaxID=13616 RepID=UPI00044361D4|nr:uncharacterized protein LOC103097117 [Monodelphis domestica]XP_056655066.1 uncharacterized protein LOC103097117 [Monodelphis domestica]